MGAKFPDDLIKNAKYFQNPSPTHPCIKYANQMNQNLAITPTDISFYNLVVSAIL